jgi:parvulin-like peptidyl-prolyl isomerase
MKISPMVFQGFLVGAALLSGLSPAVSAKVVNRTVATVNGEPILLSEFNKNWNAFVDQQKNMMPAERMTPEWEKQTKKKMLEQMIDDRLLLQEAKKRKLRVNQRDLENGVIQVKSRFLPEAGQRDLQTIVQRLSAERPQPADAAQNPAVDLSAAWKELEKTNAAAVKEAEAKFKEELNKEGLSYKKFEDRIRDQLGVVQLTTQEVRSRTGEPSDADVRQIYDRLLLAVDGKKVPGLDAESAEDLESLARYFKGQTGEQVGARHILLRVSADASLKEKSAARKKLEDIRQQILKGADFGEMAQKHSDDKTSAVRGGSLGSFGRGEMVPAFEKAAFSLPVGQVSSIVETDFGYHLIKVEEKKAAQKLKFEDLKDDLKEYLYRAKAQENFETFVRDIRKKADVKVVMDPTEASPQ